jgi:hypothetical protein
MRALVPILLVALAISAAAQIPDPVSAAERGLRGHVRALRIYEVRVDSLAGVGSLRRMRLAERVLFDGRGREIEDLWIPDSGAATIMTCDYDRASRLIARRLAAVSVVGGETLVTPAEPPAARVERYATTVDRAGDPVERVAWNDAGVVVARVVWLRDRDGTVLADSSFDAGRLVRFRTYLRDVQRGSVRTTFIPAGHGAPVLAMMEEFAPDGRPERRIEFRGDTTIDLRFDAGRQVAGSTSVADAVDERCTEYELDRHGNPARAWTWRRFEQEGTVGWRPVSEAIIRVQE